MRLLLLLLVAVNSYKFKVIGFNRKQRRVLDDVLKSYTNVLGPVISIQRHAKYTIENGHMDDHLGYTDWEYTRGRLTNIKVLIDIDRLYYTNAVYSVILHEVLHVLGGHHSTVKGSVMNMSISTLNGRALPMRKAKLNTYDWRQLLC